MPKSDVLPLVTVSIVSHGHGAMLPGLLRDLEYCPEVAKIILTRNIPEPDIDLMHSASLTVVDNPRPKGFGANHNSAFLEQRTPFFVVMNPDVRLDGNPFPALLDSMKDDDVALCAPAVINPSGFLEDSARRFPSLVDLIRKRLGFYDGRVEYALGDPPMATPWVAGMFMMIRSEDYAALDGFDEGFFLYYEDVDICARLWRRGRKVMLCPSVYVMHDASRASHRDLRHMRWHFFSLMRYFRKYGLRHGPPVS